MSEFKKNDKVFDLKKSCEHTNKVPIVKKITGPNPKYRFYTTNFEKIANLDHKGRQTIFIKKFVTF